MKLMRNSPRSSVRVVRGYEPSACFTVTVALPSGRPSGAVTRPCMAPVWLVCACTVAPNPGDSSADVAQRAKHAANSARRVVLRCDADAGRMSAELFGEDLRDLVLKRQG